MLLDNCYANAEFCIMLHVSRVYFEFESEKHFDSKKHKGGWSQVASIAFLSLTPFVSFAMLDCVFDVSPGGVDISTPLLCSPSGSSLRPPGILKTLMIRGIPPAPDYGDNTHTSAKMLNCPLKRNRFRY